MSRLSPPAVCCGAALVAAAAGLAALLRSPLVLAPPLSPEHAHLRLPDQAWGDAPVDDSVRPFPVPGDDSIVAETAAAVSAALASGRPIVPVPLVGRWGVPAADFTSLLQGMANATTAADWAAWRWLQGAPNYVTNIAGLAVHFVHAIGSACDGAATSDALPVKRIPLLLLHGWPGSVLEFHRFIPTLLSTCPRVVVPAAAAAASGAGMGDGGEVVTFRVAWDVVAPSLVGYGFSDGAERSGMGE